MYNGEPAAYAERATVLGCSRHPSINSLVPSSTFSTCIALGSYVHARTSKIGLEDALLSSMCLFWTCARKSESVLNRRWQKSQVTLRWHWHAADPGTVVMKTFRTPSTTSSINLTSVPSPVLFPLAVRRNIFEGASSIQIRGDTIAPENWNDTSKLFK